MKPDGCQFPSLKSIAEGNARLPLRGRLIHFVRKRLSQQQIRELQRYTHSAATLWGNLKDSSEQTAIIKAEPLEAGDWVRVRSPKEIAATLDSTGKLKGCSFMTANGMGQYCGTYQRVLQPMTRFVNECDMTSLKKCKGLVLLAGVLCKGGTNLGRCDRGCYVFWREEWLEKVDCPLPLHKGQVEENPVQKACPLPSSPAIYPDRALQPGDYVRVRSKKDILTTLDNDGKLKGCSFSDAMTHYCGTVQCVLQQMRRFIDEEEKCTAKHCSGLVLLKDVMCPGNTNLGHCDRSCLLFWREEWLEKL